MNEELINYAGYDAVDSILTKEKVACIATCNFILYGHTNLLPIHEKILSKEELKKNGAKLLGLKK